METVNLEELPYLPFYVNPPGEFDTMMLNVGLFLIGLVILAGVAYLSLHSLPEKMSHGRIQMELVAVMALIGLLTHNNAFWIAALLLAMVRVPDFGSIFQSMADSLGRLAGRPAPAPDPATAAAEPAHDPEPVVEDASQEEK